MSSRPKLHFFQFWTIKAAGAISLTDSFAAVAAKPGDGFLRICTRTRKESLPFLRIRAWPSASELATVFNDTNGKISGYIGMLRGFVDDAQRLLGTPENTFLPDYDQLLAVKSKEAPWVSAFKAGATASNDEPGISTCVGDSKYRNVTKWDWTESIRENVKFESFDAGFELASVLLSLGQWYYGLAVYASEAATTNSSDPLNILAYKSFLAAAGIFRSVSKLAKKLGVYVSMQEDLQDCTIDAWVHTSVAHAEEIALDWCLSQGEGNFSITDVARVSRDLMLKFQLAFDSLNQLESASANSKVIKKWSAYLNFKRLMYTGVCYHYSALDKVSQKRGSIVLKSSSTHGTVITGLQQAVTSLRESEAEARKYVETDPKGAGRDKAGPAGMSRGFLTSAETVLRKYENEKDDKSPKVLPELPQPLCVAAPLMYQLPPISGEWLSSDKETVKWEQVQGLQGLGKNIPVRTSSTPSEQLSSQGSGEQRLDSPGKGAGTLRAKSVDANARSSPAVDQTVQPLVTTVPALSNKPAEAEPKSGGVLKRWLGVGKSDESHSRESSSPSTGFGSAGARSSVPSKTSGTASGGPDFAPINVPLYPFRNKANGGQLLVKTDSKGASGVTPPPEPSPTKPPAPVLLKSHSAFAGAMTAEQPQPAPSKGGLSIFRKHSSPPPETSKQAQGVLANFRKHSSPPPESPKLLETAGPPPSSPPQTDTAVPKVKQMAFGFGRKASASKEPEPPTEEPSKFKFGFGRKTSQPAAPEPPPQEPKKIIFGKGSLRAAAPPDPETALPVQENTIFGTALRRSPQPRGSIPSYEQPAPAPEPQAAPEVYATTPFENRKLAFAASMSTMPTTSANPAASKPTPSVVATPSSPTPKLTLLGRIASMTRRPDGTPKSPKSEGTLVIARSPDDVPNFAPINVPVRMKAGAPAPPPAEDRRPSAPQAAAAKQPTATASKDGDRELPRSDSYTKSLLPSNVALLNVNDAIPADPRDVPVTPEPEPLSARVSPAPAHVTHLAVGNRTGSSKLSKFQVPKSSSDDSVMSVPVTGTASPRHRSPGLMQNTESSRQYSKFTGDFSSASASATPPQGAAEAAKDDKCSLM